MGYNGITNTNSVGGGEGNFHPCWDKKAFAQNNYLNVLQLDVEYIRLFTLDICIGYSLYVFPWLVCKDYNVT